MSRGYRSLADGLAVKYYHMEKGHGGFGLLWTPNGCEVHLGRHLWDFWKRGAR